MSWDQGQAVKRIINCLLNAFPRVGTCYLVETVSAFTLSSLYYSSYAESFSTIIVYHNGGNIEYASHEKATQNRTLDNASIWYVVGLRLR